MAFEALTTPWGFPCFVHFPCVHAAATTPVQRTGALAAQTYPSVSAFPETTIGSVCTSSFSSLLSVYSRCGLHTRVVTKTVTVIRRLQTFRLLHACSGCFRLERSPGGACTRWKAPPCHGARGERSFAEPCPNSEVVPRGSFPLQQGSAITEIPVVFFYIVAA